MRKARLQKPRRMLGAMCLNARAMRVPALMLALLGSAGCSQSARSQQPAFVEQLIAELEAEPIRNPPAKLFRFQYDGREVYFVPPHCCDMPSVVYDADGQRLCSPDGGITGRGDGKCPDFFEARREEMLIWADER